MPLKKLFLAPGGFWIVDLQRNSGVNQQSVTKVALEHYLFEQTQGYVGPKSAVKPPPLNAFSYYLDDIKVKEAYTRVYNDGRGTDRGEGSALSTVPHSVEFFPPLNWDNVYNRALDKLNDKVRGSLDLAVDIAESHQTLKMLHFSERVKDYTQTFFKRRFGVLRAIAGARLEFMYGVKPLLSSLYGAADESLRVVINKHEKFRVRADDKGYKVDKILVQTYFGPYYMDADAVNIKLSTTLGIDVNTDQHDASRWSSLNPVSIAWELMPYSFVVDWFVNVGGYLRNYETYMLNANKFRSGYRSDFAAFSGTAKEEFPIPSGSTGSDIITASVKGLRFNRTILANYPSPYLPRLRADLGSSRLFNAAALLAQFLGGDFLPTDRIRKRKPYIPRKYRKVYWLK